MLWFTTGPCRFPSSLTETTMRGARIQVWSQAIPAAGVCDFASAGIHDAALKACEWFGIPLDEVKTNRSQDEPEAPAGTPPDAAATPSKAAPASAPENTTPNPPLKFRLDKLDRAHPYFTERGITQEAIIDFGLGYFTGDKGIMVGRIAIPIHNVKGEVVAYAGRWPGNPPDGTPKYRLPTGFRKGLELFNLDRASREPADKPLVIVEGFFDAVKLHQHGCRKVVALMGSSLSAAQEELIRKHTNGQSQAILMLDEDDAGQAGRDDIAARLAKFCFVKVHQFEKPGTQPEQLSAEEVAQLFGGVA